jgi:hypothetical protein
MNESGSLKPFMPDEGVMDRPRDDLLVAGQPPHHADLGFCRDRTNQNANPNAKAILFAEVYRYLQAGELRLSLIKKEKLVLDWKKRQATRAAVRYTVETMLDQLPRAYTPQIYEQKCEQIYQHVFDSYSGQGQGIYRSN